MTAPLITVSGPPGSGTTTVVDALVDRYGYEHISGGDIFRAEAERRGVSLAELTRLSEEDDSIDKGLDAKQQEIIAQHAAGDRIPDGPGLILESRLAGHFADYEADVSIWLDASLHERLSRIDDRAETAVELKEREASEANRYREYHGIDINDLSVYDLVLKTDNLGPGEVIEIVTTALETYGVTS